jgi:chemotaxis signal transduction protein
MSAGYVTCRVAHQAFAFPLEQVREIVRMDRIEPLPGMAAPMAGVLMVRGTPLPVFDLRQLEAPDGHGDVLVFDVDGDPLGVAVEQVTAVLSAAETPVSEAPISRALPAYVRAVRETSGGPVFEVDLPGLLDAGTQGWSEALAGLSEPAQT